MDRDEQDAWAAVAARWDDDEAHRAYLAAHSDLDGLAEAGRRYREALERNPSDEVALRWRDEVIRRATALAFAQIPRTRPARERPALRRAILAFLVVGAIAGFAFVALRLGALGPGALP